MRKSTLLVFSTIAFVAGCPPIASTTPEPVIPQPHATVDVVANLIQDSPCDEDTESPVREVPAALNGTDAFQNEIHDCQRLVIGHPGTVTARFGPLVGIFPIHFNLVLPDTDYAHEQVVATIYNWGGYTGPEPYGPLGIEPGWSCLWIQRVGATWRGSIEHVDRTSGGCPTRQRAAARWNLVGVENPNPHPGTEALPPTARWSWEAGSADRHYIEIRCGTRWCSFGVPGFVARHAGRFHQLPADSIPGWYDEQHLGVAGPNGTLVPGPWARISPSAEYAQARREGLDRIDEVFREGLIAARMSFEASPAVASYRDKLSLSPATGGTGLEGDIRMHWRRRWFFFGRRHRAWIEDPGGNGSEPAQVEYMGGASHAAIGATRWRWMKEDEQAWISCPRNSCCSVAP